MADLSPAFRNRVIGVHGQIGREWLKNLAEIQERLILQWSLADPIPAADLSYNYLAYAEGAEGDPVVLKIGVPNPELFSEIQALKIYGGVSAARLIDTDLELGALLLERLVPGKDLRSVKEDAEATRIAAALMKRLWLPAPHGHVFPTAADWCGGFQRYLASFHPDGPLPAAMVQKAAGLSRDLLASPDEELLLHGDLHHMNILYDDLRGWVAIDPKGVIGEPAFEIGSFLLNPYPDLIHWPDLRSIQDRRIRILAEQLGLDEKRAREWSFVRGVLSAIWSVEDGESWNYGIEVAKTVLRE